MDDNRFDNLTRAVGFATSRRQMLRAVTSAAAGGLLGALGLGHFASADELSENSDVVAEDATATASPTPSPTATVEPSPTTVPAEEVEPTPAPIDPSLCAQGLTVCAGNCVDTNSDPSHCGGCAGIGGTACTGGTICWSGTCACPDGTIACGSACANVACDLANCGGCGASCAPDDACLDGVCSLAPHGWVALTVPATSGWIDTGIDLGSGATVTIRATGAVSAGGGGERPPIGTPGCLAAPGSPAPDLGCAALVGLIGNGAPFEVGLGVSFMTEQTGRLYLAVNDPTPGDNSGSFHAFIYQSGGEAIVPGSNDGGTSGEESPDGVLLPDGGSSSMSLSSCTGTGSTCTTNADCCSDVCVNGTCKSGRIAIGGTCDETGDCVSGLLCRASKCCKDVPLTCSVNNDCCSGNCIGGTCCKSINTACGADSHCCGAAICVSGSCCGPTNATCTDNSKCCSGVCVGGICKSGPVALEGTCDDSVDCVSGLLCRSGKCCKDVQLTCSTNSNCCSGNCQNGTCCKSNSTSCAVNADCCSGVCVNGTCASGPITLGGTCDQSIDCVSGLLCRNEVCCKDVPLTCTASTDCCSGNCQNGVCCKSNDTSCSGNGDCCSGYCAPPDSGGNRICKCGDLQSDPGNCGSCGVTCRPDQVCSSGTCICSPALITTCQLGSIWNSSTCRCDCDGSTTPCDSLFATFETQCAVDPGTGAELDPEACSAYWDSLTSTEQQYIRDGYTLGETVLESNTVVSTGPEDGEVVEAGSTCRRRELVYRKKTSLGFTAFRYYVSRYWCSNGTTSTKGTWLMNFRDVNPTFKVDGSWGGSGKKYRTIDQYWTPSVNKQYAVQTELHIENCVTRLGCYLDYYPWILSRTTQHGELISDDHGTS